MADILATKHDASLQRFLEPLSNIDGGTNTSDSASTSNLFPLASLKKITDLLHRAAFEKVANVREGGEEQKLIRHIRDVSRRKLDDYITKCPEAAPLLGTFGKPIAYYSALARTLTLALTPTLTLTPTPTSTPALTVTLTLALAVTLIPALTLGPVVVSGTQDVKWEGQRGRAQSYDPVTKKYKVKMMDGKPVRRGTTRHLHSITPITPINVRSLSNTTDPF